MTFWPTTKLPIHLELPIGEEKTVSAEKRKEIMERVKELEDAEAEKEKERYDKGRVISRVAVWFGCEMMQERAWNRNGLDRSLSRRRCRHWTSKSPRLERQSEWDKSNHQREPIETVSQSW
jgi:hypothetical protein